MPTTVQTPPVEKAENIHSRPDVVSSYAFTTIAKV